MRLTLPLLSPALMGRQQVSARNCTSSRSPASPVTNDPTHKKRAGFRLLCQFAPFDDVDVTVRDQFTRNPATGASRGQREPQRHWASNQRLENVAVQGRVIKRTCPPVPFAFPSTKMIPSATTKLIDRLSEHPDDTVLPWQVIVECLACLRR